MKKVLERMEIEEGFKTGLMSAVLAGALLAGVPTAQASGVMLDPGHGGKDPGAVYGDVYEKDIVSEVAAKLKKLIPDVALTRDSDSFVELSKRSELSNERDSDLFVSLHVNSSEKPPTTAGSEVWYFNGSKEGEQLASKLASALDSKRGIKPAYAPKAKKISVLRRTKAPAVLIELGFLNDDKDRKDMQSPVWQQETAIKIAKVINDYLDTKKG